MGLERFNVLIIKNVFSNKKDDNFCYHLFYSRPEGLSWISSTLGKFRNRTFGSCLLNFLAIRHKCRTEIRSNHCTLSCRLIISTTTIEYFMGRMTENEPENVDYSVMAVFYLFAVLFEFVPIRLLAFLFHLRIFFVSLESTIRWNFI